MQAPDYEFRSTILPALHSRQDILSIGRWLQGAKRFYLQQFRPIKTLDPAFVNELPFGEAELADFCRGLGMFFNECAVRE
jgi:pyruvate formate lyase activating enzyme